MEIWAAREKNGVLSLFFKKPQFVSGMDGDFWESNGNYFSFLKDNDFPEITFENSPQKIKLELIKTKYVNTDKNRVEVTVGEYYTNELGNKVYKINSYKEEYRCFCCETIEMHDCSFIFNNFDVLNYSHMYPITEEYYNSIKNLYFDFKEKLDKIRLEKK